MSVFEVRQGTSPVILGFPHTGTDVPAGIWDRLNDNGRKLADTDWHIHRLYDGLLADATTVRATFHRYVIDANRDLRGEASIPGRIRRVWSRKRTSMGKRSGKMASRRARPTSLCGCGTFMRPIMRRLPPKSSASEQTTVWQSFTIATPFAPTSRSSSKASCQTSTSGRTWARPAMARSSRRR